MGEHYNYTKPSKGGAVLNNKAEGAHVLLDKGDLKVNGPYLDDIRSDQEAKYRKGRAHAFKKSTKKANPKKAASKSKETTSAPVAKKTATKKTVAKKTVAKKTTSQKVKK